MTSIARTAPFSLSTATVLEIGNEASTVQGWSSAHMPVCVDFALGVTLLVTKSLRHDPPRPIELEHAIEVTEDVVMPLAAKLAGGSELVLKGRGAALLLQTQVVQGSTQGAFTLEEVEALFNQLVSISEGRPVSQVSLPTNRHFYATLVILREFMHHLRFHQLTTQT